jgi:hypothetical protein|tara:strand:+ start:705 stop:962 length:258 start_codon:yes stop_codon:yes gene_type:complete
MCAGSLAHFQDAGKLDLSPKLRSPSLGFVVNSQLNSTQLLSKSSSKRLRVVIPDDLALGIAGRVPCPQALEHLLTEPIGFLLARL